MATNPYLKDAIKQKIQTIDPNTFAYDANKDIADYQRKSIDIYNQTGKWDTPEQINYNNLANELRISNYGYSGGRDGTEKIYQDKPVVTTPTTNNTPKFTYTNPQSNGIYDSSNTMINNATQQNNNLNNVNNQLINNMNNELANPKTPEQIQAERLAEFNNYLKNWSLGMTKEEYLAQAQQLANSNANLKYDAVGNDLRAKLASMLAGYDAQLGNVNNQFQQAYTQNEQDAYDSKKAIQNMLAQRGLLGSGVDVGNQQANAMQANQARQAIDINKINTINELTGAKNQAEIETNAQLNNLLSEKNDYLAQQGNQALADYMQYDKEARQSASDNFWKGQDYQLNKDAARNDLLAKLQANNLAQYQTGTNVNQQQQQIDQAGKEFAATMNYNYDKMNSEEKMFYADLAQKKSQFTQQLNAEGDRFYAELGVTREQMQQEADQFDRQLGFNKEELEQEWKLESNRLATQIKIANIDAGVALQEIQMKKDQFKEQLKENGGDNSELMMKENDRIDGIIYETMTRLYNKEISPQQAQSLLGSVLDGSMLSTATKGAKAAYFRDILGIPDGEVKEDDVKGYINKSSQPSGGINDIQNTYSQPAKPQPTADDFWSKFSTYTK